MPRVQRTFKIEGFATLERDLRNPRLTQKPMEDLYTDAAATGQGAARKAIDGGTHRAIRSVGSSVTSKMARVYTALPPVVSRSIDVGRKKGLPTRQLLPGIIRWREAVGHPDRAIEIVRLIQRRGTSGQRFKLAASSAVEARLPFLYGRARAAIKREWAKR